MKGFKNSSGYDASLQFIGGAKAAADTMRQNILNSVNTEDLYQISGNKYYISKDMPLSKIPENLLPGDAVLFERGGLWRIGWKEDTVIPEGVIFGAYGVGEKPKFYGSIYKYADRTLWEKCGDHLWKRLMLGGNAGIMVFDEKYALGVKKWSLDEMTQNYDFFYESDTEFLYLYYDGDIEDDFDSIEIGQRGNMIYMQSNTVLDNICIRYGGSHGVVSGRGTENVTITNCEIGYMGGSRQFDQVRFGNGIELQLGIKNVTVKNNWVYQCYDAGVTFQTWTSANLDTYYHGIDFCDNLIEFCYYGIEFFTTCFESNGLYSEYKNIHFKGNNIRFSGYTWCHEQRPDKWMASHIRGGQWAYVKETEDFEISDNIFDCCRECIIFWWWHDESKNFIHPEAHNGLTVKNNTYYQGKTDDNRCMTFHVNTPIYAENGDELQKAIQHFDSKPEKIEWLLKTYN